MYKQNSTIQWVKETKKDYTNTKLMNMISETETYTVRQNKNLKKKLARMKTGTKWSEERKLEYFL